MLDRTNSSFDYAAVESASSQHQRMVRAGSLASVSSNASDQQEFNSNTRQAPGSPTERTSTKSIFFFFFSL